MISKSWVRLLMVAGLVTVCGGWMQSARAEEDKTAQTEKLFREGVDLYLQGKYADAQRKLKAVLDNDPRKELAARLVDEAGTRIMARMMADHRMGNEPAYIWQLYRKYYMAKLADKERMAKMATRLVDPATSEDERALLYREFAELGHYAVPVLANYLKDANHEDFRTYARIAIARMGPRAVLPVIELIDHAEPLMRENAILVLADILPLDPRAIPALKARLEKDPNEAVKRVASRVLQRVTGLAPDAFKSSAEYYYDLANRYYLDRAGVAEEAEDVDGMVWHLNANGELATVQYPLWAWNDQMAEANVLKGIAVAPDYTAFYPLWACVEAAQYAEIKDLVDIVKEQPAMNTFSAEEKKQVEEWDKKLVNARRLVAAVGKEHCNAALAKTLADVVKYPGHSRLPSVGAFLAYEVARLDPTGELLTPPPPIVIPIKPGADPVEVSASGTPVRVGTGPATINLIIKPASVEIVAISSGAPEKNGKKEKKGEEQAPAPAPVDVTPPPVVSTSALVNGMDSPDQTVQYACAVALGQIDRFPVKWIGSDKVAKILGRGVSENKALQILLVEENSDKSNEMKSRLEGLGFGVTQAISGRDGLLQARSFPPKDIAVIAENLRRDLNSDQVLEELKADVRTRYLPVGIMHVRNDRDVIKSRFGTEIALVEREANGNDLKTQVDAVAAKRAQESVPKRDAHNIAVLCAQTLARIDCTSTHLVVDQAVEDCIGALVNRPADLRIPVAEFLGHAEGGTKKDKAAEALKAVFLDANAPVELRRAAVRALGRVQQDGLDEVYLKAQADADQEVKDISAEALGQKSRDIKVIGEFIRSQRIDKDQKEK